MVAIPRWVRLAITITMVLLITAGPALAADDDEDKPWFDPAVGRLTAEKPWLQWLVGVGFLVGVAAIAFKNPHRSHLD